MNLTLLMYWFPLLIGVGFSARLLPRRPAVGLGLVCALFWMGAVLGNVPVLTWGRVVPAVFSALAIVLLAWGSVGQETSEEAVSASGQRSGGSADGGPADRPAVVAPARAAEPAVGLESEALTPLRGFSTRALLAVAGQFDAWLEVHRFNEDPWQDFDELLRGVLFQWVGAAHVRTYRVLSEGDMLIPLREMDVSTAAHSMSARRGIEGFVATTGRPYITGDPVQGNLVNQLAREHRAGVGPSPTRGTAGTREAREGLAWCFPIVRGAHKVGVVSVGLFEVFPSAGGDAEGRVLSDGLKLRAPGVPWSRTQLELVERIVAQFWNTLTEVCRSRMALTTDPRSGVLTRQSFFETGREVVAAAYAEAEPVSVAVIGVEGLRALDDAGQWSVTDEICATASQVLRERLRCDDRLGRFDDARFVLLMRRVDSELATLIMRELLGRLHEVLGGRLPGEVEMGLRCGLAGSGVPAGEGTDDRRGLTELVSSALEACHRARSASVLMTSDLAPAPHAVVTPSETGQVRTEEPAVNED